MDSLPLRDCIVALDGKFEQTHGSPHLANLAALIRSNGGKHSTKITDTVTHLVIPPSGVNNDSLKFKQAGEASDVKIVTYDWLLASANNKLKADEGAFSIVQPVSSQNGRSTKGKKRAHSPTPVKTDSSDEDTDSKPPAKKSKDGQKAKTRALQIPVDEMCSLAGLYHVYIDDSGIIYDAALNQTNAGNNNNKFYRIQVLESPSGDYQTWTRWGRVGEQGKGMLLEGGALGLAVGQFNKKFKKKTGLSWDRRLDPTPTNLKTPKYTFIERKYEDDSSDDDHFSRVSSPRKATTQGHLTAATKRAESTLPEAVQRLMQLIFNRQLFDDTMREMDYDADKLPLGKLSKNTLQRGFKALQELGELLDNPALADEVHNMTYQQAVEAISNSFYTIIPHSFGRQRPPVIGSDERLRKEITLLESLSDMEIATAIMKDTSGKDDINHLDRQFKGLGLQEMTPLETTSSEYKQLHDYLIKSHGSTHHLEFKVQDIFRIERKGEEDRFVKVKGSDRRLLWHGSRCTNFGGILSQGLRIAPPEAPVSGYAFGKGVYLADISSKSGNYCHPSTSGNTGLLLLCEAELGKPMLELENGNSNAAAMAKAQGSIATWGKGATGPVGWKDASCVNENLAGVMMPDTRKEPGRTNYASGYLMYNEYIVYNVSQIKLRYLLRVKMTGGF
ncbi:hypothetical protein MMC28_004035 [Mycoblastus sanguinarius]|nr:hypothetical protein [Mycoblastus sanguinarius]